MAPIDLGIIIPHAVDPKGNGILHRLCGKLRGIEPIEDDEFMGRLAMLLGVAYDLAKDINRPNHKGFTPLCIILGADKNKFPPANDKTIPVISLLLDIFQLPPHAILHAFRKPEHQSGTEYTDMLRMIVFLIANDVSVQVRDAEGCNAFHHLAQLATISNESMAIAVRLLLSRGCDINCQNELGETPLHIAAVRQLQVGPVGPRGVDILVAHGAQLLTDIINYSVMNPILFFPWGGDFHLTRVLIPLVRTYGASCRSITLGGDNALHCLLKKDSLNLHPDSDAPHPVAKFLLENGCDIRAANSSGATPLQLAIENGHLSTAQLILSQLSASPIDLSIIIPHAVDSEGNSILHHLCGKLHYWGEDEVVMDRLTMLQEVAYDLAKDINRPNHKGFTPLCIVLGASHYTHTPASDKSIRVISVLLDLGARFPDVTPLYKDNFEWASNLPWYRNATEAYRLSQSRFKPRFGDVTEVYYLLQLAHLPKIPPLVARLIMNMTECWAYTNVVKKDIRYTITHGGVPIAFPEIPCDAGFWTPRRVTFSCKPRVVHPRG